MTKQVRIYLHGTAVLLATVASKDFNAWCDANGYMPHHKSGDRWIVVK